MSYGGHFDTESKHKKISELETITNDVNFWNRLDANKIYKELNSLKNTLKDVETLKDNINSSIDTINLLKIENDLEIKELLENDISNIEESLNKLELKLF